MIRVFHPHIHNRIANDPSVFASVAPDIHGGPIDFIEMAQRPEHYWLLHNEAGDGAVIFEWSAPEVFEFHTMFLPSCRGGRALTEVRRAGDFMFANGAELIWGQTPIGNRAARWFNRKLGAMSKGRGEHYLFGPVEFFSCTKTRWNSLPR